MLYKSNFDTSTRASCDPGHLLDFDPSTIEL